MKKIVLSLFFFTSAFSQSLNRLPTLNIDKTSVTISGISSGGFLSIQLNVALSSLFKGAASVAGGVYWCAEDSIIMARFGCMKNPESINVQGKIKRAQQEAANGRIEPLENLKNSRIYIYASPNDSVISNLNNRKILQFYSRFTPKENILIRDSILSGHGWVTKDYGNSCNSEALPWLNNCHFDLAGDILSHLYGTLRPKVIPNQLLKSRLWQFEQKEFNTKDASLFDYGWIYIPEACSSGRVKCKLHVSLHGCQMNPDFIQDQFVVNSGFNGWAETNNIVILYPQNAKSLISNPYACWDWWGYSGPNYANRNGPQIIAIQKMVYRLLGLF